MEYKREFTDEERKKVYAYNKKTKCGLLSAIVACFPDDVILTEEEKKKYSAAVDLQKNVANIGKQKKSDPQKKSVKQAEKKTAAALPVKSKDLDVNTMAAVPVEVVKDAEVVPNNADDDIKALINNAVDDFMQYECKEKKETMVECSGDTWSACCEYIGINVFKKYKLLHDIQAEKTQGGTRYDEEKVSRAQSLYNSFTKLYNKDYTVMDCAEFLGVSRQYIYADGSGAVTPARLQFYKKARKDREENHRRGVVGGRRGNYIGYQALLNHDDNYSTAKIEHTTSAAAVSSSDLPRLGGLGLSDE